MVNRAFTRRSIARRASPYFGTISRFDSDLSLSSEDSTSTSFTSETGLENVEVEETRRFDVRVLEDEVALGNYPDEPAVLDDRGAGDPGLGEEPDRLLHR